MSSNSLRSLARHLDLPERTVRRAAREGLIRGERTSARRFRTSMAEEAYLRQNWSLLSRMRSALRTEPNVRLAVLIGSQATGSAAPRSDIDVLTVLKDPAVARVADLTGRLEQRMDRPVQIVRLQDGEKSPSLMADALAHGRVLVDRDGLWPQLRAREDAWRRAARREPALDPAALVDLTVS